MGNNKYWYYNRSRSSKSTTSAASEDQVVYTDGSALNNGRTDSRAGWSNYWGPSDSRNKSGRVSNGEQTSNRGELTAINSALQTIKNQSPSGGSYTIRTDSQYAINSSGKWGDRWETNGWQTSKGGDVKNRDLIEPIRNQISDLRSQNVAVKLDYVPGHSGDAGNLTADSMARSGART